jgi:DNA-binding NarL/FixJ family response regulator
MDKKPKMALIVAKPGPLRNSLFSLMTTLPQVNLVAECRDMASLLQMGSQIQPDLVLMESSQPGNHLQQTIRTIKREWPATRTMILVDDVCQQQEAQQAGADEVLFKGFRAASLMGLVEDLLSQHTPENGLIAPVTTPS